MADQHHTEQQFHDSLRSELVRTANNTYGPEIEPPRQRRWPIAVAAVLAFVVVLGALTLRDTRQVSADLEIVVDGNDLIVRLSNLDASRDEIEGAAAEFGLDLTIDEVPVGPTNVGRFVSSVASELPPELEPLDGQPDRFTGFRIPKNWSGEVALSLGRPARPGERWVIPSDALADGEPAGCMPLIGMTVSEASNLLAERDLSVRWLAIAGAATTYSQDNTEPIKDWMVINAAATSPTDLVVQVTEDGSWPFPADDGVPTPTNPDC